MSTSVWKRDLEFKFASNFRTITTILEYGAGANEYGADGLNGLYF